MSSPYCGAKNTPKGRRAGTFEQCKKARQIRRYGTFQIDEILKQPKKETKELIKPKNPTIPKKLKSGNIDVVGLINLLIDQVDNIWNAEKWNQHSAEKMNRIKKQIKLFTPLLKTPQTEKNKELVEELLKATRNGNTIFNALRQETPIKNEKNDKADKILNDTLKVIKKRFERGKQKIEPKIEPIKEEQTIEPKIEPTIERFKNDNEDNRSTNQIIKLNETSDEREKRDAILETDTRQLNWIAKKENINSFIQGTDFLFKVLGPDRWKKYKKLTNNDPVRSFKFMFSDLAQLKTQARYKKMLYPNWRQLITLRRAGQVGQRDKLLINEYVYDNLDELREKFPQPEGERHEPDKVAFDFSVDEIKKLKARRNKK